MILARWEVLDLADFEIHDLPSGPPRPAGPAGGPEAELRRIEEALTASRGRVAGPEGAAEALGVPPSTLESRIRRLGIDKHAFRRRGSASGS